jgi:type I restriction enzyme S subunit
VNYRFPGHEGVEMVDSSFGPVPSGWSVMNLSQLVTTQYGYTESASTDVVGPKFLRGMDINKNSYIEWDSVPYCPIGERERDRYRLSKGDIVVIRMADPGKVGIVETDVDAVFASYLIRLSITSSLVRPHYLFYFLLSERYQDYVTGASTGTTRKSASAGVMTAIDVALPPEPLMNRFEEVIGDIRMALNALLGKNSVLRRTRDLLLPRLISGELGVSNLDINTRELSA